MPADAPSPPETPAAQWDGVAQIAMGHGKVDVGEIQHEGRVGLLFSPREQFIPVGDPGMLGHGERTHYWPQPGDVVIWLDGPERGETIIRELRHLHPAPTARDEEREATRRINADTIALILDEHANLQAGMLNVGYLAVKIAETFDPTPPRTPDLDARIAEAVAREREACAKVMDARADFTRRDCDFHKQERDTGAWFCAKERTSGFECLCQHAEEQAEEAAAAIRARARAASGPQGGVRDG